MDHPDQLLAKADACHDDDLPAAAALLRTLALADLSPACRPRAAFLFNHVLGELRGDWPAAQQRVEALAAIAGAQAPHALWRHAGAAARHAGDALAQARHRQALAAASGAAPARTAELIELAALSFALEGREVTEAAHAAHHALAPLSAPAWQQPGPLDADVAALCNNIASHFVDRPLAELARPALRETLTEAARQSEVFWRRAGGWVQHARACHLRALASHALHAPADALHHAERGLALLDEHDHDGAESVDRAFLLLELALAHQRLDRPHDATQARAAAGTLARDFDDPSLQRWVDERVARNAELAAVPAWS